MKQKRKFLRTALELILAAAMMGCSSAKQSTTIAETTVSPETTAAAEPTKKAETSGTDKEDEGTWAIYMYMCGSDLESKWNLATKNLLNLMNSGRTDDTVIVAETGGSTVWNNNFVDETKTQRWLYTDGDMNVVDELDLQDMGAEDTLADFLEYASTNYPADHTMVILWDHGGGTLGGVCIDRNFDGDTLSLTEVHNAFARVYNLDEDDPPVDIVGFDACLMATIDVADTLKDVADYLVASEETEPGDGWNYKAIGDALGENPTISAHDLGVTICDSYLEGLEAADQADTATLSLTNLHKIGELTNAFSTFVDEMVVDAYNDPLLFKEFAVDANATENYGGNSRAEGYTDLVDISGFVQNAGDRISSSQAVLDALDECVEYKVTSDYRPNGGGLSFYYDFDGMADKNTDYDTQGTIEPLKVLYTLGVSDAVDETKGEYMKKLGLDPDNLPEIKTFENYDFDGAEIQFNENGAAYADFGSGVSDCITDAMYRMYVFRDGEVYLLGEDDEVKGDYNTGVITDKSLNNWGYFDGNLAFMELTYDCDDYNLYSVPVHLAGDEDTMYLQVAYDYDTGKWEVLGARTDGGATTMTDRAIYIEEGTEVTLLQYRVNDDGYLEEEEGGTFTYSEENCFEYKALEDGSYAMKFVIEDLYTNRASSGYAYFNLENGERIYK